MNLPPLRQSLRAGTFASAVLFLGTAFNVPGALAQDAHAAQALDRARIDEVVKQLNRGRFMGQVRVAPLYDLKKSERVTAASKEDQHCSEGEFVWSPDAKALAFFSDCAKAGEQADLYLTRLDGSPARRLTELKGYVEAPAFSPDGTSVAFLYVESATRPAGALAAMKPSAGVIGEEGGKIERVALPPSIRPSRLLPC
jgi:dipeptidyl aminopeptidase/acylaminoacyl peptidase